MKHRGSPLAWGVVCLIAVLVVAPPLVAGRAVPPHLDILSAGIRELSPLAPDRVVGREVVLEIEVAASPSCDLGAPRYGFLVDADRDPRTGFARRHGSRAQRRAFRALRRMGIRRLGIDAALSVGCDPDSATLSSALGPVSLATDPATGATSIRIHTLVERLPSVHFHWVAFAAEDDRVVRLPARPRRRTLRRDGEGHASWSIFELARY